MKHLAQVYCCGVVMGTLHYFGYFNYLLLTIKSSAEISDTEITFLRKRLNRKSILSMCMYFRIFQSEKASIKVKP